MLACSSASHVASGPINHPSSPSQRLPAHGSVCARKSDLHLLKASQICSCTQGRSRFHKRLCQNYAGVRCPTTYNELTLGPVAYWSSSECFANCRPVEISSRYKMPNVIELIYAIVKWKNIILHSFKRTKHILISKYNTFQVNNCVIFFVLNK